MGHSRKAGILFQKRLKHFYDHIKKAGAGSRGLVHSSDACSLVANRRSNAYQMLTRQDALELL